MRIASYPCGNKIWTAQGFKPLKGGTAWLTLERGKCKEGIAIYFNYQGYRMRISLPKPILFLFLTTGRPMRELSLDTKNFRKLASTPSFERRLALTKARMKILNGIAPEIQQLVENMEAFEDEIVNTGQEKNQVDSDGKDNEGKEQGK